MHISKEVDYGLRALIVIGNQPQELLTSKEIAKQFEIPYNFLSLILPKLVRAGLIASVQGPKGGYRLAKAPKQISFLAVIRALEGEMQLMDCNQDGLCKLDNFCSMAKIWSHAKSHFEDYFAEITLEQCLSK